MVDYYQEEDHPWGVKPTHFIRQTKDLLKPGTVLDLGGGDGKNALYLAREGFKVTNVDSHPKALKTFEEMAEKEKLSVETIQADLNDFEIENTYDNIIATFIFHFLKRETTLNLVEQMREKTSNRGVNVIIAFTKHGDFYRPETKHLFFAEDRELLNIYEDWELLRYFKMLGGTKEKTMQERIGIAARKP